eukprot:4437905-Pleurochrysis_carterae.AAC.1
MERASQQGRRGARDERESCAAECASAAALIEMHAKACAAHSAEAPRTRLADARFRQACTRDPHLRCARSGAVGEDAPDLRLLRAQARRLLKGSVRGVSPIRPDPHAARLCFRSRQHATCSREPRSGCSLDK